MLLVFRQNLTHLTNLQKVSRFGKNTKITGRIDKRHKNSKILLGEDCLIEGNLITETEKSIINIGNNVFIAGSTIIDCVASVTIEDDVLISYQCVLADSDNHSLRYSYRKHDLADWKKGKHDWETTRTNSIKISRGVWIGMRSLILKGVVIGEGSVVGAGSVVTKSIPPWTIVAGNPARIIREIPEHER